MASILAKMRMLPQWVIASGIIVGLSISWACAVMSALAIRCVSDNKWTEQPMACTDEVRDLSRSDASVPSIAKKKSQTDCRR